MNMKFTIRIVAACMWLSLVGCKENFSFYSQLMRSDVYVQQYNDTKYDFLWVLDNSPSMVNRRQFVRDNIQNFINILNSRKAVDFQMAVTTTDEIAHHGDLMTGTGGVRVVSSSSPTAVADFASIVNAVADSTSSFWEQGLESAYKAISLHGSEFMRTGVPLIIIIVTDEDDYSCSSHCFGPEPENNPDTTIYSYDRYVTYFTGVKATENSHTFVFPITGISTGACSVMTYGSRYIAVQEEVGGLGVTGSICNTEMQASYEAIAQVIGDRGMVFKLSQVGSQQGMQLYVDGELVPYTADNYRFDAASNSIIFTGFIPKNGAVIEISYAQNTD